MHTAARHAAPLAALAAAAILGAACDRPASPQAPAPKAEQPAAAPPAPVEAPPAPPPAPVEPSKPTEAAKPAAPAKVASPSKPAAKPAPVSAEAKAEKVVTASGKGERHKLGAGQCKVCHRIQYDSWVKSGHARKALDCEGCHGDGSEYAKNSVMRDLTRAKAAGLIFQRAQFCEKCHPTADDSFLPKAHAHKPKPEP